MQNPTTGGKKTASKQLQTNQAHLHWESSHSKQTALVSYLCGTTLAGYQSQFEQLQAPAIIEARKLPRFNAILSNLACMQAHVEANRFMQAWYFSKTSETWALLKVLVFPELSALSLMFQILIFLGQARCNTKLDELSGRWPTAQVVSN